MKKTVFNLVACGLLSCAGMLQAQTNTNYGTESFENNTTGHYVSAFGKKALQSNTTGWGNTASGYMSMRDNQTGTYNTAVGGFALATSNSSWQNTTVGYKSQEFASGSGNTTMGYRVLQANSGSENVALGRYAMQNSTSSRGNSVVGAGSLKNSTTAYDNSGLGYYTLFNVSSGYQNVALGHKAGHNLTTGSRNIVIGPYTEANTSYNYNIIMGYRSAAPAGNNNIVIGKKVTLPTGTNNAMNIGGVLYGSGFQSALPESATSDVVNGKIGINVMNPTQALSVSGRVAIAPVGTVSDEAYNGNIIVTKPQASGQYINLVRQGSYPWSIGTVYNTSDFAIGAGTANDASFTNPFFIIHSGGNVGIGTNSPDYKLDVDGTVRAHQVLVNLREGADFVFEKGYQLKPIEEVHDFVKENKHLPGVAPAAEMVESGLDMGEFQIKLLQKVEELTLYVAQQNEKIIELESKINK